jgi:hypothetical protein
VNHTFRGNEVNELIGRYKAGELTLEELAQDFRTRRWPRTKPRSQMTYPELAARTEEDPETDVPDSFDDVEAAFFRHDLSVEEYSRLRAAMAEALKTEEQRGKR